MRSCKKGGTGCLPPPCRAGVSAARLQVTHLDPLRTADPRSAQAAPLVTLACATTATGWKVTRWSIDRRVQQLIAGQQRPVPGASREGVPVLAPSPTRPRRRKPGRRYQAPSTPGRQDANPRAAVATSRAFPAQLTHRAGPPGHQSFQVFALSTRYPQNAGSYPQFGGGYPLFIHSPSTGYRM